MLSENFWAENQFIDEIIQFVPAPSQEYQEAIRNAFSQPDFQNSFKLINKSDGLFNSVVKLESYFKAQLLEVKRSNKTLSSKRFDDYLMSVVTAIFIALLEHPQLSTELRKAAANDVDNFMNAIDAISQTPSSKINSLEKIRDYITKKAERLESKHEFQTFADYFNHTEKAKLENPRTVEPYYYWPYESSKLDVFNDLLQKGSFIDENQYFKESFKHKNVVEHNKTLWKKSQTAMFALLYLLFKDKFYEGEKLSVISLKLFKLPDSSERSILNNYRFFIKRVNEKYLNDNYKSIVSLINKLIL